MDDLDRLIDQGAQEMAQREPPETLTSAVMERVAAGRKPTPQQAWLWGGMTAASVLAGFLAFVVVNRTPPPVEPVRGEPVATTRSAESRPQPPPGATASPSEPKPLAARRSPTRLTEIDEAAETGDPITFESISPEPIDVPRLEFAFAPVEPLHIEPIEVEPISASND